jgi:hypothetical protein
MSGKTHENLHLSVIPTKVGIDSLAAFFHAFVVISFKMTPK